MKKIMYSARSFKWLLLSVVIISVGCQQKEQTREKSSITEDIDPETASVIKSLYDEALLHQHSYHLLNELCVEIGPRLSGSEGAKRGIDWVHQVMNDQGFDEVYRQDVMVPHWERGAQETAFMTNGLGEISELAFLAVGGSVATPPSGITGEIIEVASLEALEELDKDQVTGKIVFFNKAFDRRNVSQSASYGATVGIRTQGANKAAALGAVASVMRSLSSAEDDVPHTGTMRYIEGADSIPHGALGVQSAIRLAEEIKSGPVKLTLKINSKWFPDAPSHNVIGVIRGSQYPDEIITVGGHMDSWDVGQGAHDDGAGCMHALGVLHLFKQLKIQPKRTIRAVMFINEENGTRGGQKYAAVAKEENENHLVAIESDAGGFSPRGFGVSGSDEQLAKVRSWLPYFNPNTIAFINKGGGGVDIRPLHDAINTPMIGLNTEGQRAFDYHHSANDVIENVHPRELELGTASLAALIYLIDKHGF